MTKPAPSEQDERRYPAIETRPVPAGAKMPPKVPSPPRPDQARLDKLLDAANAASGHVLNVYLTFLLFGLYLAIIFGSTTHEQLLRESPVTLPLLDVGLPLLGFYWVAPALFVLLHLNLLLQLYLLSGKLHRLDQAIGSPSDRKQETEAQQDRRAQIYPFPFGQMLIGRQHGRLMRFLLWLIVILTVLALPVVLLLFGQVRFLPYHDAATTMWHRVMVPMDVLLILIFWRPIRHPGDRLLRHPGRWLWHYGKALPGTLAAIVLSWLILTFPGDKDADWGDPMEQRLFALFQLDGRFAELYLREGWKRYLRETVTHERGGQPTWAPTGYLFDRLPFVHRKLELREAQLIVSQPDPAFIEGNNDETVLAYTRGLDLKGRDLRHADLSLTDLRKADLRHANLDHADLRGADLRGALLEDSELVGAKLNLDEASEQHTRLANANLRRAILRGADFRGANLQGADLLNADLQGAVLARADLQGADLKAADLQSADLRGANLQGGQLSCHDFETYNVVTTKCAKLQGADLRTADFQSADLRMASLQGSNLQGAQLQGADLLGADLQSAFLVWANLRGASLTGANLQAAELDATNLQGTGLRGASLQGASLAEADLQGADLRGAHLWRVRLDEQEDLSDWWVLTDLRRIDVDPIQYLEFWVDEATRQIADEETQNSVAEQLQRALEPDDQPEVPAFPKAWQSAPNVMFEPDDPLPQRLGWGARVWATEDDYDEDLAGFLGELACGQDSTVHVARGLARRALGDDDRLYARRLAARLVGDDCPPAAGLPDDWRKELEALAAR